MDVDESVSLSKPKTPAKPGKEPEEVSITHKTPAEIKPTVRFFMNNIIENRNIASLHIIIAKLNEV